ncbi:MAG: L-fucose/L-arabinose isomerase family protein [Ignavibacteriae bacterium]|nr:L-fucose/L-arabinose isomerase family protein [Ignavibacteriota bacterium]
MKKVFYLILLIFLHTSIVKSSENKYSNSYDQPGNQQESKQDENKIKIGLYGIGLDVYWSQFKGLKERLEDYQKLIEEHIAKSDAQIEIINTGIIDNPVQAREAGKFLSGQNVDAIFLYISTYALSSTVLPVVQEAKVPVIVLSIQPTKAIDYETFNALEDRGKMTGEWLAYCQACSAPEIASVFKKADINYHLITGSLDDESVWHEINDWTKAIKVTSNLRETRIGLLGHYYGGMLDVYSDMTQLSVTFGSHFEILEMSSLNKYFNEATDSQILDKINQFQNAFIVDPNCSEYELSRAAKSSIALDAIVNNKNLGCIAYHYEGSDDKEYENIITSVIPGNTLLTMNGVPVAGEYEIKNVIAMKIMDLLGVGGSFSEFYAIDLNDDIVMLGHDGPGHAKISEGKVKLVPLPVYHGKPGKGLSIQMSVKNGPITMLSVVQEKDGTTKLLVAEGESVPGPVLNIGNTNSRYKFKKGAKQFLKEWSEQGPAHHMAIGVGHVAETIEKIAYILNIKCIKI